MDTYVSTCLNIDACIGMYINACRSVCCYFICVDVKIRGCICGWFCIPLCEAVRVRVHTSLELRRIAAGWGE